MFAKYDFILRCGIDRSRRDFSVSNNQKGRAQITTWCCISKQSCLTVLWLWCLFCCGDWTLLEDQGTVTWSTTPMYSRWCLVTSADALWPNSKICALLPLKSWGREGCKHHITIFFCVKGALLLWRWISAVSIYLPKEVKRFAYVRFLPCL